MQYGTMRTQADHLPTFMKTAKKQGTDCEDIEGYAGSKMIPG